MRLRAFFVSIGIAPQGRIGVLKRIVRLVHKCTLERRCVDGGVA